MSNESFTLNDLIYKLYGKRKVHSQIRDRCIKVLKQYILAGYLIRPTLNYKYITKVVEPTTEQEDLRERIIAVRERYNRIYSVSTEFFRGLLVSDLD
jgi:hypothetical protein